MKEKINEIIKILNETKNILKTEDKREKLDNALKISNSIDNERYPTYVFHCWYVRSVVKKEIPTEEHIDMIQRLKNIGELINVNNHK